VTKIIILKLLFQNISLNQEGTTYGPRRATFQLEISLLTEIRPA
jgi:hypothetical protein